MTEQTSLITDEQRFVLSLLRASMITGSEVYVPETDGDARESLSIILRNGILLTVYPAIKKTEGEKSALLQRLNTDLRQQYFITLKQTVLQDHEGNLALERLGDAGFQCIALKGWEMKTFYPEPTMRQMADLDILVRPYDFKRIRTVMEGLDYTADSESSWKHDSFRKGEVHIEMHKRLTDDSSEIQKWERGMWSRAVRARENIYKMSPEDYYIFHFVHLHKDFMNGSLGLRRIVDTWLLQKQSIDMETVKANLERFGLWTFHERMVHLSHATMGDEPIDEDSEVLLAHAFRHGIYGSGISYKAGRIAAMGKDLKSGKRISLMKAVFLPYKRMKAQFPILEKYPILLPWCWIKRIVHFLRGDMKKNRAKLDYSGIKEEDFQEMKRFFKAGGVR